MGLVRGRWVFLKPLNQEYACREVLETEEAFIFGP